jgi:predicted metal-dependent HD superfamily phosphohydrolase
MVKVEYHLVKETEWYVTNLLEKKIPPAIIYHTIDHTRDVVTNCELIGGESGLTEDELNLAMISAWFHDVGYIAGPKNHEMLSASIAAEFLASHGADHLIIDEIKKCILATRIPQNPGNKVAAVVCDADLMLLTAEDYFEITEKMRQERINLSGETVTRESFHHNSVNFFQKHEFHTDYGKRILLPKKMRNLDRIRNEIARIENETENQ